MKTADSENSTPLGKTHTLFPVLLFPNKYSKKISALKKDTITLESAPNVSGLSKMDVDEGVCAAASDEIIDNAEGKPHECPVGGKT